MIDYKCKDCLWWDTEHVSVEYIVAIKWKPTPGFCRRRRAGVISVEKNHVGVHPVMDADEFCGEFKEDK